MWFQLVLVASILCVAWNVWRLRREASVRWENTYGDSDDEPSIVRHVGDSQADAPDWDGQEVKDAGLGDVEWEDRYVGFRAQSQRHKADNTTVP